MRDPEIELLTFENHTACQCILKSEVYHTETISLPNDEPARRNGKNSDPVRRVPAAVAAAISMSEQRTAIDTNITTTSESSSPNCRCPNHFARLNGSDCKCDCPTRPSRAMDMCIKLKTGSEHFSIVERRQVQLI